jgi:hypothetical protein
MPKPKASLAAALAQKPLPPAAPEPVSEPRAKPSKADEGNIKTSLLIKRDLLAALKSLALQRRVSVNDVVIEAIANHLALHGRRAA